VQNIGNIKNDVLWLHRCRLHPDDVVKGCAGADDATRMHVQFR